MTRKDQTGKNTCLKLQYFNGFFAIYYNKKYKQMNIHEKIITRTSYCGNTSPSLCIKELIAHNELY